MKHLRIMRYVDEVARTGSIRKAADHLNVMASAVNRRIMDLEEELGAPLFERRPRGVRLIAAGEVFVHYLREQDSGVERMRSQIEDLKGLRRGTVCIACSQALAMSHAQTSFSANCAPATCQSPPQYLPKNSCACSRQCAANRANWVLEIDSGRRRSSRASMSGTNSFRSSSCQDQDCVFAITQAHAAQLDKCRRYPSDCQGRCRVFIRLRYAGITDPRKGSMSGCRCHPSPVCLPPAAAAPSPRVTAINV